MPFCANCHSRKLTAALRATCLSNDKIPRLLRTEVTTQRGLAALPAVWCLYRSNKNNWKEKRSPSWEAFLFRQRVSWKRFLQTTHVVVCSTQAINNLDRVTSWHLSISFPPHAVTSRVKDSWWCYSLVPWVTSWIEISFVNSSQWCL